MQIPRLLYSLAFFTQIPKTVDLFGAILEVHILPERSIYGDLKTAANSNLPSTFWEFSLSYIALALVLPMKISIVRGRSNRG